ncbi:hypothetical protein CLOM_g3057 [Closterium sp. NIES-68]|nr:hypothetical protein CLOM_g3057 [Closterium sp. NIES-68]GJP77865.1 hypothetical protein CLOP_g8199 [Closterium sp. NIES-67]
MNCFRFGQVLRDDSPPRHHQHHHRGAHGHSWHGCTRPVLVDDPGDDDDEHGGYGVRPGVPRSHSKEKERLQQQQQQEVQAQAQAPQVEASQSLEGEQQRRVREGNSAEQREGELHTEHCTVGSGARDRSGTGSDAALGQEEGGEEDEQQQLQVRLKQQIERTLQQQEGEQGELQQPREKVQAAAAIQPGACARSHSSPVPALTVASTAARHVQFQQQQQQESKHSKHSKHGKQERGGVLGGFMSAPASPMFRTTKHAQSAAATTAALAGSTSVGGPGRHPLLRRSTTPSSSYHHHHHHHHHSSTASSPRISRSSPGPSAQSPSSVASSRPSSRDGAGSGSGRSLRRDGSSMGLSSGRRGSSSGKGGSSAVLPLPGGHNLPGILTRNFSRNSSSSTASTPPLAPAMPGAYPPKSPSVKEKERSRERDRGERGGEVKGERDKGRGGVGSSSGMERGPLEDADIEALRELQQRHCLHIFSYAELRAATINFAPENLLGSGGFGRVYRGEVFLPPLKMPAGEASNSGEIALEAGGQEGEGAERGGAGEQGAGGRVEVAVKKLNSKSMQGHKEWMVEVSLLAAASHPNLVRLIGCCAEGDRRLLVYELLPLGSLDRLLFRPAASSSSASSTSPASAASPGCDPGQGPPGSRPLSLDWSTRLRVALGAAKGLAYLHEEMEPKVIYRDLKTSNVLLTASFHAKLSDFGLAREGPDGDSEYVSTMVRGTAGYAAPEYMLTGQLTSKNDVWSFGVLLLELLTGRPSIDSKRPHPEGNLVLYARPYLQQPADIVKIMDSALTAASPPPAAAAKVAEVARWCLAMDPTHRPVMSQVVDVLTFLSSQQWS